MSDLLSSLEADHVPHTQQQVQPEGPTWEQVQAERESLRQQLEHAQRLVGEQGRQLGEYRSMLERKPEPVVDISDDDFITNPKTATERLLEQKLTSVTSKLQEIENQTRIAEFERKHPEARSVLQNQEFVQWANSGPYAYVATRAAQGDLEAADALLTLYKSQDSGSQTGLAAVQTERPTGGFANATRKPISREKYRQALMRGESIPAEVMKELQEAYRNKNFV
jgi:hypothetical protein